MDIITVNREEKIEIPVNLIQYFIDAFDNTDIAD